MTLSYKQKIIIKFILILEFLINNQFILPFHMLISVIYKWLYFKSDKKLSKTNFLLDDIKLDFKHYYNLRQTGTALKNMNLVFICDGNRRWFKKNKDSFFNTYSDIKMIGLYKINEMVKYCYLEGCDSASFYVLGIRNLKRGGIVTEMIDYIKNIDVLDLPVKIRFYGNIELLKDEKLVSKIEEIERRSLNSDFNDKSFKVNLFFVYNYSDCDQDVNNKRLYFNDQVDMIIRTSGEKRLSDFLARQVSNGTAVEFIDTYWPDLQLSQLYLLGQKYLLEEVYLN
ncbi:RER2 [Hepatospora eriocheir]|uniref:RER2 n=1 Tax=Hepatospora eriocheir TaxID=1081669 RepID=A0A1X0QBC9_9MICR|nr:RER2 [Hepatospora eriocheir]